MIALPLENVVMIMAGAMAQDKTLATQMWALVGISSIHINTRWSAYNPRAQEVKIEDPRGKLVS